MFAITFFFGNRAVSLRVELNEIFSRESVKFLYRIKIDSLSSATIVDNFFCLFKQDISTIKLAIQRSTNYLSTQSLGHF